MRHYNQEVSAEPSISEHNAASIAPEQFLKELTSLTASISSKSFTVLSHLVLSPPTSGLMQSQTRWVLAGTIPSPRYLRRDDTKPNPLVRPAWVRHPAAGRRGPISHPGIWGSSGGAGSTHKLPANSSEGLQEIETSLCGTGSFQPPGPASPPPRTSSPRPLTVLRLPRQPSGSRRYRHTFSTAASASPA